MKTLVSFCKPDRELWDLCCDHGFIGLYAFTQDLFNHIHFVDKQPHIIDRLINLLNKANVPLESMSFHKIDASEIDQVIKGNLILAGVGGKLGVKILGRLYNKGHLQAHRVIFSPHSQEQDSLDQIMKLENFPYELMNSTRVIEAGRNRHIFVLERKPKTC